MNAARSKSVILLDATNTSTQFVPWHLRHLLHLLHIATSYRIRMATMNAARIRKVTTFATAISTILVRDTGLRSYIALSFQD